MRLMAADSGTARMALGNIIALSSFTICKRMQIFPANSPNYIGFCLLNQANPGRTYSLPENNFQVGMAIRCSGSVYLL